jgi:hypothetical protein
VLRRQHDELIVRLCPEDEEAALAMPHARPMDFTNRPMSGFVTIAPAGLPRTPKLLRTEPLKALVIGAFVRGLSMRDVESLCEQAGLGKLSKSTASRMCEELRERFDQFKRRSLYDVNLVALFLDATFISVRPAGRRKACWSPGGSPTRANASCWR